MVQPSTPSRRVLGTPIREISSTPSAQGSEARLAAIITALQDIDLVSHTPHYVVVRGEKPGVYSNRFVSLSLISNTFFSNIFNQQVCVHCSWN